MTYTQFYEGLQMGHQSCVSLDHFKIYKTKWVCL